MHFRITEHSQYLEIVFLAEESANAFSLSCARELRALVRAHGRWKLPVVVRSAHPRMFCSGGNLTEYKAMKGRAPGLRANREITSALDSFGRWGVVKLAVLEGDAFGGGVEWLARFDARWMVPSAVIGFWQRRIGLSFGWGGGAWWARRLGGGESLVGLLLNEARVLSAFECQRLGLVDRVISRERIADELVRWSAGETVGWSVKRERAVFERLWLGVKHSSVLKDWRGK